MGPTEVGMRGSAPWACIAKGELEISGTLASLIRAGHAIGGREFTGNGWIP